VRAESQRARRTTAKEPRMNTVCKPDGVSPRLRLCPGFSKGHSSKRELQEVLPAAKTEVPGGRRLLPQFEFV